MLNRLSFFVLLLGACTQNPGAPAGNPDAPKAPAPGAIRFSQVAQVSEYGSADNWCNANYTENVPVFPDPANANRRFFVLEAGLYHVVTTHNQQKSSWLARRTPDGGFELFTSDNFPSCLSNRKNFTLRPDARGFRYNNHTRIDYPVEWQPDNGRVFLEFPADTYFGIEVYRAPN